MRITLPQFYSALRKTLAPLYLLSGDEPLLLQEALAAILQTAEQQGFQDKQRLESSDSEQINQLHSACFNRSLWAEKTVIIAHFSPAKAEQHPWQAVLTQFSTQPPSDKLLIVLLGKLTPAQANAAWLQKLAAKSVWLTIPTVTLAQFPVFLQQRLTAAGFSIDAPALELLNEQVEGNLLAAQQAVQKLQLLHPEGGTLHAKDIVALLAPQQRYTVFDLVNAIQARQGRKISRIIMTLAAEGTEPILVLWALARECRRQKKAVWLNHLFAIEQALKGFNPDSAPVWLLLEQTSFRLAGKAAA